MLRANGFTERELDLLLKINPAKILGIAPPATTAPLGRRQGVRRESHKVGRPGLRGYQHLNGGSSLSSSREMTMRMRILVGVLTGLAIVVAVSALAQTTKARSAWSVPRTEDGRPDLQGVWANNGMSPLERPKQFGLRATMTDAELADLKKRAQLLVDGGDAFFGEELFLAALQGKDKFKSADTQTGNYDQTWLSERIWDNRTSLIIDPPDGRIPPPAAGAAERAAAQRAAHGRAAAPPIARRTWRSARAASASARRTSSPAIRATSRSSRARMPSRCAAR